MGGTKWKGYLVLTCYHLTCNHRIDAIDTSAPYLLAWRLGSTREGACQTSCRVHVTSLTSGEELWDSGEVRGAVRELTYAGRELERGELCVWFVEVADDADEQACSAPAVFGREGKVEGVEPAETLTIAVLATDAGELATSCDPTLAFLREGVWAEACGITCDAHDPYLLHVAPPADMSRRWVQASLLHPAGLVTVRHERAGHRERLALTVPPDLTVCLAWRGEQTLLACGTHTFC